MPFSGVVDPELPAPAGRHCIAVSPGFSNAAARGHTPIMKKPTLCFQEMARGHFIVNRLENKYGAEPVETAYKEPVI